MNNTLIKALKTYRAGYSRDIEMFGENYWKEKILAEFGSLLQGENEWSDYYEDDIANPLDSVNSILDLAKILVDEDYDWNS